MKHCIQYNYYRPILEHNMAIAKQIFLFCIVALVFNMQQVANCANATEECVALTNKPKPVIGHYALNDTGTNQNVTCILAQFSALIEIEQDRYIALNNGTVNRTLSRCGIHSSTHFAKLVIDYECGHQIGLAFGSSADGETYLASLDGTYNVSNTNKLTFSNSTVGSIFTSEAGYHYQCNAEQAIHLKFNLVENMTNPNMLYLSNVAFEVFRIAQSQNFNTSPQLCSLDSESSNMVLYVVVTCITVFILASFVAIPVYYFIRKRNQAAETPYQPM